MPALYIASRQFLLGSPSHRMETHIEHLPESAGSSIDARASTAVKRPRTALQTEDLREFAQRQRQRQAESAAAAASEPPQTAHPGAASALAGALAPHFAAEDAQAKQQRQAQEQQRPPPAAFDRVLVDVPCSGLGVLAKRADMRWRRQPADLDELSQLQVRTAVRGHHRLEA